MNKLFVGTLCILCITSCSNAGNTAPSQSQNNVAPITIYNSPSLENPNVPYTTVTICIPNSKTECQTINNIIVDTGSTGLRIYNTQFTQDFLNQLTPASPTTGESGVVGECAQFGSGWTWGIVTQVDMYIGGLNVAGSGEKALSLPIDLLTAGPTFPTTPTSCGDTGTYNDFGGANGIIGINPARYDDEQGANSSQDSYYFNCTGTLNNTCVQTAYPLAQQVKNPIISFQPNPQYAPESPPDNNGVIISLANTEIPNAGSTGVTSTTGNLIFGIGTNSKNNSNKPYNIFYGNPSSQIKSIQTFYAQYGTDVESTYNLSIFDSGTNVFLFNDNNIPVCAGTLSGFYCPDSNVLNLSAGIASYNGTTPSSNEAFSIINTATFFSQFNDTPTSSIPAVIPGLAANSQSLSSGLNNNVFIWGLPFFYGKNIYIGIESTISTFPANGGSINGPYFAY